MKIAFKISPAAQDLSNMHLLAEAGKDEISFLIFSKNPFVAHGFYAYSFNKFIEADEYAQSLQKIVQDNHSLQQQFSSCHICYNGNESVLTPTPYFSDADKPAMCNLMFGEDRSTLCFSESVRAQDIKNVYRVPQKIYDAVNASFPKNSFSHSSSAQLERTAEDILSCIVYHNNIKLVLFKDGALQIVRYSEYASPADVCYHLLNACRQFNVAPDSVALLLSGMIDAHSNLYKEIYRYFLNISFAQVPDDVTIEPNLKEHPDHFYSHLIALAQCV